MPLATAADGREAGAGRYLRHRPEQTLLYQLVGRHYPAFVEQLAEAGKQLPCHVRQAFDAYLQCGWLEHGFLRLRCDSCHAEHLVAFSCKRRGFCLREPLNNPAWARRRLCGRLRFGLGERGLVIPNERAQTRRRPRKGPSRKGFVGEAAARARRASAVATATVTRRGTHDVRLLRQKRAPRRVIQRFPCCGARRMADGAAWLVDRVLPERPIRQWVLSFPFPLRFLVATHPALIGRVLGIVYRVIAGHLIRQAGYTQQSARQSARTGAVTLIQRFGSALNLNIYFNPALFVALP